MVPELHQASKDEHMYMPHGPVLTSISLNMSFIRNSTGGPQSEATRGIQEVLLEACMTGFQDPEAQKVVLPLQICRLKHVSERADANARAWWLAVGRPVHFKFRVCSVVSGVPKAFWFQPGAMFSPITFGMGRGQLC